MSTYTNEELVALIQNGREDLVEQLWEQVKRYCFSRANLAFKRLGGRFGVTVEDLGQTAFVALKMALKGYSPDHGAMFITWLTYHLQNEWAALCGYRARRRDMLDFCKSLDEPVIDGDGNEAPLADFVPDRVDYIEAVEQRVCNEELHEALERVLATIPAPEAEVLREHYFLERDLTDIAQDEGVSLSAVSARKRQGLRSMRKQVNTRKGVALREFLTDQNLYRGVGLQQFRNSWTSPVEATLLRWERASKPEKT